MNEALQTYDLVQYDTGNTTIYVAEDDFQNVNPEQSVPAGYIEENDGGIDVCVGIFANKHSVDISDYVGTVDDYDVAFELMVEKMENLRSD